MPNKPKGSFITGLFEHELMVLFIISGVFGVFVVHLRTTKCSAKITEKRLLTKIHELTIINDGT